MKTYYKVVRRDGDSLTSCVAPSKELTIEYVLDREIIAPIGGLLVFRDLRKAVEFCQHDWNGRVLRCTGLDPVPLPPERFSHLHPHIGVTPDTDRYDRLVRWLCEDVWHGFYHHHFAVYESWPTGTVAVKRLRPIEYVYGTSWGGNI